MLAESQQSLPKTKSDRLTESLLEESGNETGKKANQKSNTLLYDNLFKSVLTSSVYDIANETELTYLKRLSKDKHCQIYLKREDQQPVHSFKLRGAYQKLSSLTHNERRAGVVAASAGNHAQGVAMSAQKLAIDATIVMPLTTPEIKADNVRRLGAQVKLVGSSFNEANTAAIELSKQQNKVFIPPFDDYQVIAGQGTIGKEILQQLPLADVVFVPVGGGGLLAGIAAFIKQLKPNVKIIGVEATDSACLTAALSAGHPVTLPNVGLFADGVAVKTIGKESFPIIQSFCDQVITVSNDEICNAIKVIFEHTRVIAEPAGALALAGTLQYTQQNIPPAPTKAETNEQHLVAILSGANMNFHTLRYVSERCELAEKRETVLSVTIPERTGSFREFCSRLGGRAITEFNYRYANQLQASIFVGIKLSGDASESSNLINELREHYTVDDFTDNELAKLHVRYMVGGQSNERISEKLFHFEFPGHPGALEKFLQTINDTWNITLFHYRNHGAAIGQVLVGFQVAENEELSFNRELKKLPHPWREETHNLAFKRFLA